MLGHSGQMGAGFWNVSTESRVVLQQLRIPWVIRAARMLILSDELMSCRAADANECLDLRYRAFAACGEPIERSVEHMSIVQAPWLL